MDDSLGTGGKKNVQAVVRAPGAAAEAVSDALGTAGRAAISLKEGAYGAADSVSRLVSAPAELADRRRRQQQVYLYIFLLSQLCLVLPFGKNSM